MKRIMGALLFLALLAGCNPAAAEDESGYRGTWIYSEESEGSYLFEIYHLGADHKVYYAREAFGPYYYSGGRTYEGEWETRKNGIYIKYYYNVGADARLTTEGNLELSMGLGKFITLTRLQGPAEYAPDPVPELDANPSGLPLDDLIALRERLNFAMWSSQDYQEVIIPAGVWEIGVDIPAAHWTISALEGSYVSVVYCDRLDEYKQSAGPLWKGWNGILSGRKDDNRHEIDLDMKEGMYFINHGSVRFSTYTGKPDLGFR